MGNQNSSKREYRKEHSKLFKGLIKIYQKDHGINPIGVNSSHPLGLKINSEGFEDSVQVFVRKRPIFSHEISAGEYDVISCDTEGGIVVHDGRMAPDMKPINAFIENISYKFKKGNVFNEFVTTETVYVKSVKPLLSGVCKKGDISTCFMFGQTGSGKTFTISGIMDLLSKDLFNFLAFNQKNLAVVVSAFEMIGDNCFDLLNKERTKVQLLEGSDNLIHLKGAKELVVQNPGQMVYLYKYAANTRETAATKVNSTSSRSHYVFKIFLKDIKGEKDYGLLNMIDLAGSERNEDTMYHNADRRKEACQINTSLMALKNCMRIWADNRKKGTNNHIPFRDSKLTQLLRDCFENVSSKKKENNRRLSVISTVSPCCTDCEHSENSLKHMCQLLNDNDSIGTERYVIGKYIERITEMSQGKVIQKEKKIKPVLQWENNDVIQWLSTTNKGQFKKYVKYFPPTVDGKQLMKFQGKRFGQIVGNDDVGMAMRNALVNEMKKISKEKFKKAKIKRELQK